MSLLILLGVSIAIQLVLFIFAYIFRTDKLTDLSYGSTFIILALYSFLTYGVTIGKTILLSMISLWGLRLAGYLFIRIIKSGRDKRFDGIREDFWKFLFFWLGQGLSVWAIMLPSLLYFSSRSNLDILSVLGLSIWGLGLIIETVADIQKFKFKSDPKNKGKWIESGLWKYSRHPNYFGEVLCWIGVFIFCLTSLSGLNILIGLISPVYITILLVFVTGIPRLEEKYDKKYGDRKSYQKYKRKTNSLIPWFPGD